MESFVLGKKIIRELKEKGYEAFFVGGFVRDFLLNRKVNDIDIATNAHPEKVMSIFSKTIPTGLKHGTVTVLLDHVPIEVTTYRIEGKYKDYRHPTEVKYVSSLYDDLGRRDFSMNAIAMDENREIVDPFNGKIDIIKKSIKAVGDPSARFLEDPLRMMRAIRFASQLDFLIEGSTWEAITQQAKYIKYIAIERIKAEIDKIINSDSPNTGIQLLFESNLLDYIDELKETNFNQIDAQKTASLLMETKDTVIRWFLLLKPLDSEKRLLILKKLRFSNKEINVISNLFDAYNILHQEITETSIKKVLIHTDYSICTKAIDILYILKEVNLNDKIKSLLKMNEIDKGLAVRTYSDLSITGNEVIDYFKKSPGPWVKSILDSLFHDVVYNDVINEKSLLLRRAKKYLKEYNDER